MVLVVKAETQMLHMVIDAVAYVIGNVLRHRLAEECLEIGKDAADYA